MTKTAFVLAALLVGASAQAQTANSSVEGRLIRNGDIVLIPLTVDEATAGAWIFTDSYDYRPGTLLPVNLDPSIALWDAAGHLVAFNNDVMGSFRAERPSAGIGYYDALLHVDLDVGTYTVSVGRGRNRPRTGLLADGFGRDGSIGRLATCATCTDLQYFHLQTTAGTFGTPALVSAVPEPGSAAMLVAGLALAGFAARRRRAAPAT